MLLSEELREQIDQQISAQQNAANPLADPIPQPAAPGNAIVWRGAIQIAALAGAVAAALALLSFALPPVVLLSLFWFISAPIIVMGFYSSRFRKTRITASFGARLGLLTGLAILIVSSTLNTIGLVLQRFLFHSTAELDSQIAKMFDQVHANFASQSQQSVKIMNDMLAIPEFRAGILLEQHLLWPGALSCLLRYRRRLRRLPPLPLTPRLSPRPHVVPILAHLPLRRTLTHRPLLS